MPPTNEKMEAYFGSDIESPENIEISNSPRSSTQANTQPIGPVINNDTWWDNLADELLEAEEDHGGYMAYPH